MMRIDQAAANKTFFTVSKDGILTLGPDVTWDEAAEFLLEALERQIGRRIVEVRRSPQATDQKEK